MRRHRSRHRSLPTRPQTAGTPPTHGGGGRLPASASFCDGVIDAVRAHVPIVKFQSACFERYGEHGVTALRQSIISAHQAGLLVLLDAKRGDIGVTAEHYAAAVFDGPDGGAAADAVTYSGLPRRRTPSSPCSAPARACSCSSARATPAPMRSKPSNSRTGAASLKQWPTPCASSAHRAAALRAGSRMSGPSWAQPRARRPPRSAPACPTRSS